MRIATFICSTGLRAIGGIVNKPNSQLVSKADRLCLKALQVREGSRRGLWIPIIQHLALRGHAEAMIELANWYSETNPLHGLGTAADSHSAVGLYRRAYRKGDPRAAHNMAMTCFNLGDLRGYRHWLRQAAVTGDDDAAKQLRHFETRLWHGAARKIRRLRPIQKRDGFG